MKPGDIVRLSAYEGEITRRVVEVENDRVAVCNEAEWAAAMRDGRDPVAIRFELADVLGEVQESPRSQRRQNRPQ